MSDLVFAVTFKFAQGAVLRDTVTGFQGKVTSRIEYLNGCRQYSVQPMVDTKEPHKLTDAVYFDEDRLEAVRGSEVTQEQSKAINKGGPTPRGVPTQQR